MSKKLTNEEYIEKAEKMHKNKYDYSKVEYINAKTKICITCPTHGEFFMLPHNHLQGQNCPLCSLKHKHEKITSNIEEFIKKSNKIHNSFYDYSKTKYINSQTKICITCPIHGDFLQTPNSHLRGNCCPKCSKRSYKYTIDEIIKKCNETHECKYTYEKVKYTNIKTKVCITCQIHGDFWQTLDNHVNLRRGCPHCKKSNLEKKLEDILIKYNIEFDYQKRFDWLGRQSLDFYLPQYNLAIECQGEQHFKPIDFAGKGNEWANNLFKRNIERDLIKKNKCIENNVKLLYYLNETNENKILKEIINE